MTRAGVVLATLLLVGCPDDVAQRAAVTVELGLRAPTDLVGAADGGSRVRLTWTDHATDETGYRLDVDHQPFEDSVVDGVELLPADATSFEYSTTPNTTYYFRLLAITDARESDPSNILEVTTPPAAPEGVVSISDNSRRVRVAWQDVAGETTYVIERSIDASPWVEVGTVSADLAVYFSEPLAPDTRVAHRVVAVSAHGRSDPSASVVSQTVTDRVSYFYPSTAANNGLFTSLVVPYPGILHVAHFDVESTSVTYSSLIGTVSPWITVMADGGPSGLEDVGGDGTGLAMEGEITSGKAHIVAHDRTSNALRYATNVSGPWVRTTLDAGGAKPRIARDAATGALHVAYQSSNVAGQPVLLRLARKLPGQAWTFRSFVGLPLDPAAVHSLALDGSGRPHVLLAAATGTLVHVFEDALGGLGSEQLSFPVAHGPPDYTALVIEPGGTFQAFYRGSLSKSLHHLSRAAGTTGWQGFTVDDGSGEDLGSYCVAAFDPGLNLLHAAYYDPTRRNLKYAGFAPGQGWTPRIIDTVGDVGSHVSIAPIGGLLYFAYRDESQKRLKFAVKQF